MDSPFDVTNTESACVIGTISSRDVGRATNFFHGPGESPDISGDGRGVTSGIAFSIGEDNAEFGAEALLPILLLKIFLILGARAMPRVFGGLVCSPALRLLLAALAAVIV